MSKNDTFELIVSEYIQLCILCVCTHTSTHSYTYVHTHKIHSHINKKQKKNKEQEPHRLPHPFRDNNKKVRNLFRGCKSNHLSSINKVKLAIVVEGNQKAPFSIATTPRCREGRYSFPWIFTLNRTLYC